MLADGFQGGGGPCVTLNCVLQAEMLVVSLERLCLLHRVSGWISRSESTMWYLVLRIAGGEICGSLRLLDA